MVKKDLINRNRSKLIEELIAKMEKVKRLDHAIAILEWDQETYMPLGSYKVRAEQIANLNSIKSELVCSVDYLNFKDKILSNLDRLHENELRLAKLYVDYIDKYAKIPTKLFVDLSRQQSLTVSSWRAAKSEDSLHYYLNDLELLVNFKKEEANYLNPNKNVYNTLLDNFEPGIEQSYLDELFGELRFVLKFLSENYSSKYEYNAPMISVNDEMLITDHIIHKLGFDFHYGRFDLSSHPFTTSFSSKDVRITSRFNSNKPLKGLYGAIHEVGHALYEQNICCTLLDTFAAEGASYGIHESQSLLWEAIICNNIEFVEYLCSYANNQLDMNLNPKTLYQYINYSKPNLIRVESDEIHYISHIIIRYQIEKEMFKEKFIMNDLPELWNETYKTMMGIKPESNYEGFLQDIHWAIGSFGYFPSYALGKLYSIAIAENIETQFPEYKKFISKGNIYQIHNYLKDNIHCFGKLLKPTEILDNLKIDTKQLVSTFENYIINKYKDN